MNTWNDVLKELEATKPNPHSPPGCERKGTYPTGSASSNHYANESGGDGWLFCW